MQEELSNAINHLQSAVKAIKSTQTEWHLERAVQAMHYALKNNPESPVAGMVVAPMIPATDGLHALFVKNNKDLLEALDGVTDRLEQLIEVLSAESR